jgi:hypothetical protein
VDEAEMFGEWVRALQSYATADMDAGITLLIRQQVTNFWPAIGELRTAIAAATAGREKPKCATCHGSTWVDAPPYRANGGRLYQGVTRCPDCGVPPPKVPHLAAQHSAVTGAEVREWADRDDAVPMTHEAFLERCRAIVHRMSMPKAKAVEERF